jgi:integrase
MHPDSYSHGFARLITAAGLPEGLRLHDVRYGVATMMMTGGLHPMIASAVLGHSNPSFTMSQYGHLLDGMTDTATSLSAKALGR